MGRGRGRIAVRPVGRHRAGRRHRSPSPCSARRRSGCSTNLVVLTHSTVTARGCAAYSVVAHLGVGLIVLGAVLLLGSFVLAVRTRRHGTTVPPCTPVAPPAHRRRGAPARPPA